MIIVCCVLLIFAAVSKSIMDLLQFKYYESVFSRLENDSWWNPSISWKNKYKNGDVEQGPRFFGSTTFFVFLTDAWHFFQKILLGSIFGIISILTSLYFDLDMWCLLSIWILLHVVFGATFELFWSVIFRKK